MGRELELVFDVGLAVAVGVQPIDGEILGIERIEGQKIAVRECVRIAGIRGFENGFPVSPDIEGQPGPRGEGIPGNDVCPAPPS